MKPIFVSKPQRYNEIAVGSVEFMKPIFVSKPQRQTTR